MREYKYYHPMGPSDIDLDFIAIPLDEFHLDGPIKQHYVVE